MHTTFRRLGALILVVALALGVGGVQPAAAGGNVGPRAMLQAYYYNYINPRDFGAAYQQWINPPQTYASFVAGYNDTSFVTAYFGGYQAGPTGTQEGAVPGILIGHHYDGGQVAYQGCYTVRFNPAESGLRQWLIVDGDFSALTYVPTEQAIYGGLLDIECYPYRKLSSGQGYYNVQGLLSDYFEAINNLDFAYAYGLWANPQQTYDQFVTGWQDTSETVAFYGTYQFSGTYGAAEAGRVPVVLLGYHTDGSLVGYNGCIGLSFDAGIPRHWSIYNAYLQPYPAGTVPSTAMINAALNTSCY